MAAASRYDVQLRKNQDIQARREAARMKRFFRKMPSARPVPNVTVSALPVSLLVALVADSGERTRQRAARNMEKVETTHNLHRSNIDWAVCTYDYGKHKWSSLQQQTASWSHARLMLVINHNDSSEQAYGGLRELTPGQRKARMVLHRRLVRTVWERAGRDAYAAVWLPDDDLRFDQFDLPEFLFRWRCVFAGGPPVVSQPPINHHGAEYRLEFGKSWPANGDTWKLCLKGPSVRAFGADACFLRDALAMRAGFIENQAALLDARFLDWFWDQPVALRIAKAQLRLKAEAGPDAVWCGAAAEWAAAHRSERVACAVITTEIGHDDQRSLGARTSSHFLRGFGVLDWAKVRRRLPMGAVRVYVSAPVPRVNQPASDAHTNTRTYRSALHSGG